MPVFYLTDELIFPPVNLADEDGLLAYGGDLSAERLLLAYQEGIFPWYNEPPILWWSPDPRFVLFPEELKLSASMKQVLKKGVFEITFNEDFEGVIAGCKQSLRKGQDGTWITTEVEEAYVTLHKMGYAHSVECWQDGELVGGFYGVMIGACFFGESMFAKVSNASKAAFITFVQKAKGMGLSIIDCQVYTEHLASLGARFIGRDEFLEIIQS
ncbi:leucyl/phenylalanyl-tRNA--protein transferase [[Flexibacter] sp. ATCC 35208]|uniref:leucyl/phenylalanyl-tRNA--protein transferase n=1 Tax=[Flexibacter] sp. ATCC 35208 TaxID=1936242 RepID=UPI0009D53B4E|nr:leucyl/phenylalanyl-tRNA--protein transferase [[Flexibacter] sp. ATCC 35208]OMP80299.1 leucyl/phenylalanyl-tRNA--protein transferase [[Flexibacter] sp. ATCC 35208]